MPKMLTLRWVISNYWPRRLIGEFGFLPIVRICGLTKWVHRPVQKVVNWFNNRRAKENRLERDSSQKQPPLSQNFSMSGDDDSKYESGDAQGAIGQEGLDHEVVDQEA